MGRWITQNISLFLLSLLLAFFFWAVATEAEDPTERTTISNPVPVEIRGLEEGMVAYGAENARVWVDVKAPESVLNGLGADDINAFVDLSNVEAGVKTVSVQVDVAADPTAVTNVRPDEIEVVVERVAEKEVPVESSVQGNPTPGFQAGPPELAPQSVRVRGPESLVEDVVAARVTIFLTDQRGDIRSDYEPTPVDENGDLVNEIEVVPKTVTVHVPIEQLVNSRDVPVDIELEGKLPAGYSLVGLTIQPPTVNIVGAVNAVEQTSVIKTEPLALNNVTQTMTTTLALRIPSGVTITYPQEPQVTVTLGVDVIRSSDVFEVQPTIRGLEPGLTATVGLEDPVLVVLSGPLSAMENLAASDVEVTLNLSGMSPGEYSIVPRVEVPEDIDVGDISPESLLVRIEREEPQEEPDFD